MSKYGVHKKFLRKIEPQLEVALCEAKLQLEKHENNTIPCCLHFESCGDCKYPAAWAIKHHADYETKYVCAYHKVYWEEANKVANPDNLRMFSVTRLRKEVVVQ